MKLLYIISVFIVLSLCYSCSTNDAPKDDKITIVTTTEIIGNTVQEITKDKATVISLMGPGVDPHLYKASQPDIELLQNADIIICNGLHLEGKMAEILDKISKIKPVYKMSDGVHQTLLIKTSEHTYDPHIWFDVQLWASATEYISKNISKIDPKNTTEYTSNSTSYINKLLSLDKKVKESIESIPKQQRILVTAHDAFGYFGKAYDIEVRGLQGISTLSQPGLKDITDLIDVLVERKVKSIFVESSVPKKQIEVVADGCASRGHSLTIGGTLYSDAMGAKGSKDGTYIGMVEHNVSTIVNSLK